MASKQAGHPPDVSKEWSLRVLSMGHGLTRDITQLVHSTDMHPSSPAVMCSKSGVTGHLVL